MLYFHVFINDMYLWYYELINVYNSFVHPEMRHRCSRHKKWIINILLNKWYHSYKILIILTKLLTRKWTKSCSCLLPFIHETFFTKRSLVLRRGFSIRCAILVIIWSRGIGSPCTYANVVLQMSAKSHRNWTIWLFRGWGVGGRGKIIYKF